jgi:signal transduction histidine kinase
MSTIQSKQLSDIADTKTFADSAALVEQLTREIRTISHLLHPPLLDGVGIASALRLYVDGFSERIKISVKLEMPETLRRLPKEIEIAVFGIIQECLTNIPALRQSQRSGERSCNNAGVSG